MHQLRVLNLSVEYFLQVLRGLTMKDFGIDPEAIIQTLDYADSNISGTEEEKRVLKGYLFGLLSQEMTTDQINQISPECDEASIAEAKDIMDTLPSLQEIIRHYQVCGLWLFGLVTACSHQASKTPSTVRAIMKSSKEIAEAEGCSPEEISAVYESFPQEE